MRMWIEGGFPIKNQYSHEYDTKIKSTYRQRVLGKIPKRNSNNLFRGAAIFSLASRQQLVCAKLERKVAGRAQPILISIYGLKKFHDAAAFRSLYPMNE